jgi:hypothetical protein
MVQGREAALRPTAPTSLPSKLTTCHDSDHLDTFGHELLLFGYPHGRQAVGSAGHRGMHELFIIGDPHRVHITVQAAVACNRAGADMFIRIDRPSKCCGEAAKTRRFGRNDGPEPGDVQQHIQLLDCAPAPSVRT